MAVPPLLNTRVKVATRVLFLEGLGAFAGLAATDDVAEAWDEPSVLEGYLVGGLVGHVLSGSAAVERYLDDKAPTEAPEPAAAYFAGVPGPKDAEAIHAAIRERGERLAERGPAVVAAEFTALTKRLGRRLAKEPADRIMKPFGNGVLLLDDYLETRVVELAVHYDDVAISVGTVPEIPPACLDIALSHLVGVARYRHGDLTVLRALARRERDPLGALRVF